MDQFPIYELGCALQRLKDIVGREAEPIDQLQALWTANNLLGRLLNGHPFAISFCRDAVKSLVGHIERSIGHFRDENQQFDASKPALERWRLYGITSDLDVFEHQFSAELKKISAYAVPERGIFSTERLVDSADHHIHESVHHVLPGFALSEFRAAGRCLAFGLYSASGFHAARSVESVLRKYYVMFLGEPKKDDIGMGLMASHLSDLWNAANKPLILPKENTLRHIKDVVNYDRNPLIHKNVSLEEMDATTFFNSSLGVIVEMAKEFIENDDATRQAPLPLVGDDTGVVEGMLKGIADGQAQGRRALPKRKSKAESEDA